METFIPPPLPPAVPLCAPMTRCVRRGGMEPLELQSEVDRSERKAVTRGREYKMGIYDNTPRFLILGFKQVQNKSLHAISN